MNRFPNWQNPYLNKETKADLLEKIAQGWKIAMSVILRRIQEGKMYSGASLKDWLQSLFTFSEQMQGEYELKETFQHFLDGVSWLLGEFLKFFFSKRNCL
jgi:hypothetical protein